MQSRIATLCEMQDDRYLYIHHTGDSSKLQNVRETHSLNYHASICHAYKTHNSVFNGLCSERTEVLAGERESSWKEKIPTYTNAPNVY